MAAVIFNQDSGKAIPLEPETPTDVGRGDRFDIRDRHLSHKQVRFTLLSDGRCFVQRLGSNPSLLHEKNLPRNKEVEIYNGDTVYLLAHNYPLKVILPKDGDGNTMPVPATASDHGDKYYYDDTNQDEYHTQKPSLAQMDNGSEASGTDTEEEEDEDRKNCTDEDEASVDDEWLSSESSLLGGEDWSDEDDDGHIDK